MESYNIFFINSQTQCTSWAFLCLIDPYLKYVPIFTLLLGCVAFFLAWNTYLRKSSVKVRATYTVSRHGSHYYKNYVASYTIENDKDKSIVINAVYLRIGYDLYLLLEDFRGGKDSNHLILKAYEAHQKVFKKMHWYMANDYKLDLDELLANRKVKKTIVLSTSHGKCVAKTKIKIWFPYFSFLDLGFITGLEHASLVDYKYWKEKDFISLNKKDISNNWFSFMCSIISQIVLKLKNKLSKKS
ncbi:hypothetical protein [Acinetobacter junii]|uniref:hypothetical protein n=1 Tax=Acinetobacter junii TaxID=40215 RepID=UPI00100E8F96|nr:hypothetical protein [Acinetobacter junii]RXS92960.1 hypothetical protein ETZ13_14260 [Acinetobacter junii]